MCVDNVTSTTTNSQPQQFSGATQHHSQQQQTQPLNLENGHEEAINFALNPLGTTMSRCVEDDGHTNVIG